MVNENGGEQLLWASFFEAWGKKNAHDHMSFNVEHFRTHAGSHIGYNIHPPGRSPGRSRNRCRCQCLPLIQPTTSCSTAISKAHKAIQVRTSWHRPAAVWGHAQQGLISYAGASLVRRFHCCRWVPKVDGPSACWMVGGPSLTIHRIKHAEKWPPTWRVLPGNGNPRWKLIQESAPQTGKQWQVMMITDLFPSTHIFPQMVGRFTCDLFGVLELCFYAFPINNHQPQSSSIITSHNH